MSDADRPVRLFETPADLVGQIQPGDLLMDAQGELLHVDRPVPPSHFRADQQAAVAGQHYLQCFGGEEEYVPGGHDAVRWGVAWPLRRVWVVEDDDRLARLRALCEDRRVDAAGGGRCDAGTIWPSEVLAILDSVPPVPPSALGVVAPDSGLSGGQREHGDPDEGQQ